MPPRRREPIALLLAVALKPGEWQGSAASGPQGNKHFYVCKVCRGAPRPSRIPWRVPPLCKKCRTRMVKCDKIGRPFA